MGVDELKEYGMQEMDDDEIRNLLSRMSVGVLALPDTDVPYLLPMGYSYDGESSLYFTYVVGSWSRKQDRSERYGEGRFLVYDADSMFNWESVSLIGELNEIPEPELESHEDALKNAWQQSLFQKSEDLNLKIFEFKIQEQEGYMYMGPPPGYGN